MKGTLKEESNNAYSYSLEVNSNTSTFVLQYYPECFKNCQLFGLAGLEDVLESIQYFTERDEKFTEENSKILIAKLLKPFIEEKGILILELDHYIMNYFLKLFLVSFIFRQDYESTNGSDRSLIFIKKKHLRKLVKLCLEAKETILPEPVETK